MGVSYKKSGVDYNLLDPLKIFAQEQGLKTAENNTKSGFKEVSKSRGESAYITEADEFYLAFVSEGLGSKNLIADEMRKYTNKTYYDHLGYDTVISIVMDISVVGARPIAVSSYWAIGDSHFLKDKKRMADLVKGWKKGCDEVNAVWGGGETPILKGIISSDTIDLAGAAIGIIKPKKNLILGDNLKDGDIIIFFQSSGIHVNGLTLARKLSRKLPLGYKTKLTNGVTYGEELLKVSKSYSALIGEMLNRRIDIRYMVNITGHGWRKLMRLNKSFKYEIENIGEVPEIFRFIQDKSGLSDKEMYSTFNMGAGLAVYINKKDADRVLSVAEKYNIKAWIGGRISKGEKQVNIKPLGITFNQNSLKIRA